MSGLSADGQFDANDPLQTIGGRESVHLDALSLDGDVTISEKAGFC
jgi:hypothetical protein